MKIIDISQMLAKTSAGWPGDTPYSTELKWTKEETGSVNVGKLTMSTHIGTHIDAPFHFDNEGKRVEGLALETFIGPALVVEVLDQEIITVDHLRSYSFKDSSKLLIKTNAWKDRNQFPTSIPALDEHVPAFLKEQGIDLLGIDLPSVDVLDSKRLQNHHLLHESGIQILEGIVLEHVTVGQYELIAFPLAIEHADGSPVRAVLIQR